MLRAVYGHYETSGLRYNKHRLIVCSLMKGHEVITRGLAICSTDETPIIKRGRDIARGRAVKVLTRIPEFLIRMGVSHRYSEVKRLKAWRILQRLDPQVLDALRLHGRVFKEEHMPGMRLPHEILGQTNERKTVEMVSINEFVSEPVYRIMVNPL